MDKKTIVPDAVHRLLARLQLSWYVFFITVLVTANSYFKRVRVSHENGITTRGRLRIVEEPAFAED